MIVSLTKIMLAWMTGVIIAMILADLIK